MGKIQIVIQLVGNPDAPGFDAAVAMVDGGRRRFAPFGEEEFDVRQQDGLIAFDRKKVMGFASDQVFGEFMLGEQGVGGDQAAADVEGVQ